MNNQENIDRLFQKKLQDFEQQPKPQVWSQIQGRMSQNKKRRVLFWWWSVGTAAVLVLSLLVWLPKESTGNHPITTDPVITVTPKSEDSSDSSGKKQTKDSFLKPEIEKENNSLLTEKTVVRRPTPKPNKVLDKSIIKNTTIVKSGKKQFSQLKSTYDIQVKKETIVHDATDHLSKDNLNSQKTDSLLKSPTNKTKEDMYALIDEEFLDEKAKRKKWSVAPTFGVLSSNSFTNASPLDTNLSSSTNGESTISYGIKFSYQLAEKWSFQSGFHFQEVAFSNADVAVINSSDSQANIDFASESNISLVASNNRDIPNSSDTPLNFNGNVFQEIGYIEIPLEIKYHFIEKKSLSIQLVTGFSTLFLNRNNVQVLRENTTLTGEANNLNDFNLSGNLGVDFNYRFSKNWSFMLNPMLKTQLNTFTNNSNGFQPYFIGVYSGFVFSF